MKSTIRGKGQVTLPKPIREHLHLKPGDRVKFFIDPNGGVVLLPILPPTALRGMLRSKRGAATIEEMTEAAAAGAVASSGIRKRR